MIATQSRFPASWRSISSISAGAPRHRKDGQKSKRGKGTSKPRVLIAVQRDDRMRAMVVPSEKTEDIKAALTGVVAQPATIYSDKDHTFLSVIRAFGMGHKTVVHSAKEFVRGEVHSKHGRRYRIDARACQNGGLASHEPEAPAALPGRDRLSVELSGEARIREQARPQAQDHHSDPSARHAGQAAVSGYWSAGSTNGQIRILPSTGPGASWAWSVTAPR